MRAKNGFFGMLFVAVAGASPAAAGDGIVSPMGNGQGANCRSVHAVLQKREIVDCPARQAYDFCFTREVVDRAGLLTGRMEFFSDPSKEAKIEHAPGRLRFHGTVKVVTASGQLRKEENGILDTKSKDWAGLSTITGGTGDFEGATGSLASFGNANGTGLEIGTICKR